MTCFQEAQVNRKWEEISKTMIVGNLPTVVLDGIGMLF